MVFMAKFHIFLSGFSVKFPPAEAGTCRVQQGSFSLVLN
jgi:hypothetical protein